MKKARIEKAVKQIEDAFAGVALGEGVSLREAEVIDDYGTDEERSEAREQDEHNDWQRIPDEEIESATSSLCFMDNEGLRFHLPAFMRFTLRRYRQSDSISTDSTIYRLCDPHCIEQLAAFLTDEQIDAIKTFLSVCLDVADGWLDITDAALALRCWNNDAAAIEELKAAKASSMAASLRLGAELRKIDPELIRKCQSGEATEEERQELLRLVNKAQGECGPGG